MLPGLTLLINREPGRGKCVCKGSSSALPSTNVGESKRQVESTGKEKSQAEPVGGL